MPAFTKKNPAVMFDNPKSGRSSILSPPKRGVRAAQAMVIGGFLGLLIAIAAPSRVFAATGAAGEGYGAAATVDTVLSPPLTLAKAPAGIADSAPPDFDRDGTVANVVLGTLIEIGAASAGTE